MADHKVYNLQDPDFWNPEKREENGRFFTPDDEDTNEGDYGDVLGDPDDGGDAGDNWNETLDDLHLHGASRADRDDWYDDDDGFGSDDGGDENDYDSRYHYGAGRDYSDDNANENVDDRSDIGHDSDRYYADQENGGDYEERWDDRGHRGHRDSSDVSRLSSAASEDVPSDTSRISQDDIDNDDLPDIGFPELLHDARQPQAQPGEERADNRHNQPYDRGEKSANKTGKKSGIKPEKRPGRNNRTEEAEKVDGAERTGRTEKTERPAAGTSTSTRHPIDTATLRRQILQGVLLAAALAAVILLIFYQSRTRTFTSATYRTMADLSGQENTSYLPLGSNILTYSRDGASCMNTSGSQIWNVTFEMQQPIVAKSRNVVAIGDYNGSVIYIVNDTSVLGSINTNLPIRGLTVSQSGEVAAVLNDTDVTWIYLYDSQGSQIAYFKTTMRQSGYPLSVAVSPDGKAVAISHLTMGTTSGNTSIAFYNFGAVGQNVTENNVAGYNYDDEIFPFLTYLNNNTLAAVSDKRLVFFNNNTETPTAGANVMFSAQVQGVFSNENYAAVLFPDTTGAQQYTMQIYNTSGNQISSISFSMDYTDIQLCADRVIIHNDQAMTIYNVDGTLKYEGAFQDTVRAVIPSQTSTSRLTIVTGDGKLKEMVLE